MTDINQALKDRVARKYKSNYGTKPEILLRSPGRINLIGEHTDYNRGFVLPSAVSLGIYFAIGKSPDDAHHWNAIDLNKTLDLSANASIEQRGDWSDFLLGSWLALKEINPNLPYFQAAFSADLPMGSGMSSSSALTCGVLFGLNEVFDLKLSRLEIASLAHRVEREYVGLRGGIMDQYASVLSLPNQFLLLDCNDLSHASIPVTEDMQLFLISTNVHRELTSSRYNSRSDECALAVKQINEHHKNTIASLREISHEELQNLKPHIDRIPFKRAEYVMMENSRVHEAVRAIRHSDWKELGNILYRGHCGLQTQFEVSILNLDFLVEYTKKEDWIYGARMMGGGFGGCTINISNKEPSRIFKQRLTDDYNKEFGLNPTFIPVALSGGTKLLNK
jgi:galactokinase